MIEQNLQVMSMQEFIEQYEQNPIEFIDGEIIPMAPMKFEHNTIQRFIFLKFVVYEQATNLGEARTELPFVLEDSPNWLKGARVPDVMFIRRERLDEYYANTEDYKEKPLILVPDIVVEVISPTDSYSDVNRKAEAYLEDGVKIIWVVDPKRQTVEEFTSDNPDGLTKRKKDVLSGGDVAAGFELAVSEIFG